MDNRHNEAARPGGNQSGGTTGERVSFGSLSAVNLSTGARGVKFEPQHLALLRAAANLARAEGDEAGYMLARRCLLLCQAAAYQAGEVGR